MGANGEDVYKLAQEQTAFGAKVRHAIRYLDHFGRTVLTINTV